LFYEKKFLSLLQKNVDKGLFLGKELLLDVPVGLILLLFSLVFSMKKNLILFFLLMIVCFASCENRTIFGISFSSMELNFVPLYYKYILRDSLKAEAASFLVDNMKYHYSKGKLLSPGRDLLRQRHKTDSVYFSIINGHTLFDFPEEELWISCGKVMRQTPSLRRTCIMLLERMECISIHIRIWQQIMQIQIILTYHKQS